ncbi:MAG: STAS domain-containing protein [Bacteroidia bacterium]|jgi:hypothetical protein
MNTQYELKSFPSGGGQLKVSGALTVKQSKSFKDHIMGIIPGQGNYFLSLRDVTEVDITAIQLIWSLRKEFFENGRRLTISWPQIDTTKQSLGKAGLLDPITK